MNIDKYLITEGYKEDEKFYKDKEKAQELQWKIDREWRDYLHKNRGKVGFMENDAVGMTIGPTQIRFKFQYTTMDTKWFIKTFLDKHKKYIKKISDSRRHIDVFLKEWK